MFDISSKWIWINDKEQKDSYVSFLDEFVYDGCGSVTLNLCAETNYIAYIDDRVIGYGQFAGYPDCKYADTIDITNLCKTGVNFLKITVWYEGLNSFTHIDDGAGLIYNVVSDSKILAVSNEETLSGYDGNYVSGLRKILTYQIGYTSKMIFNGQVLYNKSKEIYKTANIQRRPVKKLVEEEYLMAKEIAPFSYDLEKETVGYLSVEFNCEEDCTVNVAYGEHLLYGKVSRIIPGGYKNVGRDFSLEFVCRKGINTFTQYFVRLAGRYLDVSCDKKIKVNKIGLIPVNYPININKFDLTGLDKQIYDTCIRTLRLCMHEHYEDCPWREQALYSLDSRNQMLCGYYAFDNSDYQRANLVFISKGIRQEDGLLEITYPAINTPAIPLFSLMFVIAVGEYIEHTEDNSILKEVFSTIYVIMETFSKRIDEDGLVPNFDQPFWNFYEWTDGSHNGDELIEGSVRQNKHDLILNCAYLYAYKHYKKMLQAKGKKTYINIKKTQKAIVQRFYDIDKGLFFLSDIGTRKYSQLGNAFAVLVDAGNKNLVSKIASDKTLIEASLSMKGFVYDALLYYDNENAYHVLEEIRNNYSYMLSKEATSFWETIDGVCDEHPAGSLCHGWSAIPIYYYNILRERDII